jgi:hypothetical protein
LKFLIAILITLNVYNFSQPLFEKQIIPFDGLDSDYFGRSNAVNDSFLFISSLRYSNHIENAVYIYRRYNSNYIFEYKIHPSVPQPGISGELFGSRLLYKDGFLFVGAQNKKVNNIPVGALYIFEYENYKWTEKQKIIPPEPHTFSSLFSNAISKDNEYLVVSAFRANTEAKGAGKVFIYQYIDSQYELLQVLEPFDAKEDQFFGTSVEIKDQIIFIGSSNDSTESGIGSGSVYVYERNDSLWEFAGKYFPEQNSENLAHGCDLAINNDYLFVGTTDNVFYYAPGKVYIYKYLGPSLDLVQIIKSGDNYIDDRFGISLFAKGDSLLVSAIFDTVGSDKPGSVYLFVNEKGIWNKKYKIRPSDEINTSWFGGKCIIKDDKIFIGAHETKVNNIRPGAVYIYSDNPLSAISGNDMIPEEFQLLQNYPNPFNPTTTIDFILPKKGKVTLKLFDITGKEIKTIFSGIKDQGQHSLDLNLEGYPSGVYFYRMGYLYEENNRIYHSYITKKAVYLK